MNKVTGFDPSFREGIYYSFPADWRVLPRECTVSIRLRPHLFRSVVSQPQTHKVPS